MNKKILYGFLPIFLSLVVLLVPMRAAAAPSDYEGVFDWDGVVSFAASSGYVYTSYSGDVMSPKTQEQYYDKKAITVVYDGNISNIMVINGLVPGSVIDGKLIVYGSLVMPQNQAVMDNQYTFYIPNITFNADNENNITFGSYIRSIDTAVNFAIEVQFNEYYCTNDFVNIPFNMDVTYAAYVENNTINNEYMSSYHIVPQFRITTTFASDWAGDMRMYTNPQSNPTMDGYFAQQNQTIIDQSQTQNNLTNQQNTLIQNQTSQQHQDSQAEINQGIANSQAQINQSIQNTDEITNGYNSGVMGEAEDKFSSGAGDLTDIEDTLTDSSSSYVDNFTTSGFDTSFLQSVGPSLNYVVTWFTNFWNMGGALTSTYGLSFSIFIAFYILRVRG